MNSIVSKLDIERYVHAVIMHPFEDANELANIYFEGAIPLAEPKDIIIPELINLSKSKRALIANIVREKTNADISVVSDKEMGIIIAKGEKIEPIYVPKISIVETDEE